MPVRAGEDPAQQDKLRSAVYENCPPADNFDFFPSARALFRPTYDK